MSTHLSRRHLLATAVGGTALGVVGCLDTASEEAANWPTYGYDAGNSGYAPDVRGPTDNAEVAWTADLDASRARSPIVYDDRIYVGTNWGVQSKLQQGHVVALDREGNEQWRYLADRSIDGPLTATEDGVYGGTENGMVVALDHEGERRWRYDLGSDNDAHVIATSGKVYATSWEAGLLALDTAGDRLWEHQAETAPAIGGMPIVGDDGIYVNGKSLYAIGTDGEKNWIYDPDELKVLDPIFAEGTVFTVEGPSEGSRGERLGNRHVAAFDTAGTVEWHKHVPDSGGRSVADGSLLVSTSDALVALDAATGDRQWECACSWPEAPSVAGDVAYIATIGGQVHAVGAATGEGLWQLDLEERILSQPAISGGTVYVATEDGKLHALEESETSLSLSTR